MNDTINSAIAALEEELSTLEVECEKIRTALETLRSMQTPTKATKSKATKAKPTKKGWTPEQRAAQSAKLKKAWAKRKREAKKNAK